MKMIIGTNKNKFLSRLLVVYIIQLIIKGFDYTFGFITDITFRGQLFSLYFIIVWMVAWYLGAKINNKSRSIRQPYKLIILLVFGYLAAIITNLGYKYGDIFFFNNTEEWKDIPDYNPELTISLLLIYTLVYATGEYFQSKLQIKEEQVKSEKLAKENLLAQYKSLKNQIEPHFLFNSLSVLSSIIQTDKDLASEFLIKLSKSLRYVIEKNEFTLVTLTEEIKVATDYFFLIKTRYGNAINMSILLKDKITDDIYIPPATIQLLIENAVKHNKFSESEPLQLNIELSGKYILVLNNLNKRESLYGSTQMGLV